MRTNADISEKVLTLDSAGVREAAIRLAEIVGQDGFQPTHIVAIAEAGIHVAREMTSSFPGRPRIVIVKQQRASTSWKSRALARLPYAVTDRLRRLEQLLVARPSPKRPAAPIRLTEKDRVELLSASRILIVDDAVDSGSTLESVHLAICRAKFESAVVKSAALVTTTRNPARRPDYTVYNNRLLRFPWSNDYRG